jgi:hypothetical protein
MICTRTTRSFCAGQRRVIKYPFRMRRARVLVQQYCPRVIRERDRYQHLGIVLRRCSPWRTTWRTSYGNCCSRSRSGARTLTTLREKLIKIGAKVVSHSKYVIFQLAEVAVPRHLFATILKRIGRLRLTCASG